MNLLDSTVTMVLSKPYEQYGKWWVDVKYDCWGRESKSKLMFDSLEEAAKMKPGYKFLT